jgi:hypothetical protein
MHLPDYAGHGQEVARQSLMRSVESEGSGHDERTGCAAWGAARIEACCIERWCEGRLVMPLAYLMSVWPLPAPSPVHMRRLSRSLDHLVRAHGDMLGDDDCSLIEDAFAHAGRPQRNWVLRAARGFAPRAGGNKNACCISGWLSVMLRPPGGALQRTGQLTHTTGE